MAAGRRADRKGLGNPHDSYFRALLEMPERAADFLRCHLPAGIVPLLSDEPPDLLDGASVDERLGYRQSDRLIRAKLRSGEYIFVIVEHASSVDPAMAHRLLRYRLRVWDREGEASDVKSGRLAPVYALVVYHGKARWTAPLSPAGMVPGDPALRGGGMQGFHYRLLDLGRMPEDRLARDPDLRGGLLTLAHAYRGPVGSRVLYRIRELISEGTILERQTYRYILDTYDTNRDTLLATLETKGAATVGVFVKTMLSRVEAKGEARGEARGEVRGRASILKRLLARRFGRLPRTVQERIRGATVQELDAWGDAVLDAPTLEAVFGDTPRH